MRLARFIQQHRQTDRIRDRQGRRIDPKIFDLVLALRMYGVNTYMSCEGHRDWGYPYPWVMVAGSSRREAKRLLRESGLRWHSSPRWPGRAMFRPVNRNRSLRIMQDDVATAATTLKWRYVQNR